LRDIARIAKAAKLPKKIIAAERLALQKMLDFVIYSCYKMISQPLRAGWFGATCNSVVF
jgi:hypothetical protein